MQHIGLLGGTFDPIHLGHLHVATTVLKLLQLDKMHLIPCYQAVHRENAIANPEQRLKMIQLACQERPELICDNIEYQRAGRSYMIETLQQIKSSPNLQLYLIIGYDAFMNFKTWKNWQDILMLSHIIVVKRPYYTDQNMATAELLEQYGCSQNIIRNYRQGKICLLDIDALAISSTQIRKKIQAQQDVSDLLPLKVYQFIKEEGLYAH